MPFRVTDSSYHENLKNQIQTARQRLSTAQEQLSSGKKINRPSDNPADAAAILRLKTSQAELTQFSRSAATAQETLQTGDQTLDAYQQLLDRARTLMTRASSDTTPSEGKASLAIELDSVTEQIRQLANTKSGDGYYFGGSRSNAPPFDSNGVPAATPAVERTLQIDPQGTIVSTGPLAENVFADSAGTVLDALKAASASIRGTGDATADRNTQLSTLDRLKSFADLASVARTQVGSQLTQLDQVTARLSDQNLGVQQSVNRLESVDVAEAALNLSQANNALDAILQSAAKVGQRNLLDLLG